MTTASQVIGPGIFYSFKVQARNAIGLSEDSIPVTILASIRPTPLAAPVLTPELADYVVVVDWEPVRDQMTDFGAMITEYKVFIQQADGVYTEVADDCPSTDVDLIANTQCTIMISTLRSEPFLLEH